MFNIRANGTHKKDCVDYKEIRGLRPFVQIRKGEKTKGESLDPLKVKNSSLS